MSAPIAVAPPGTCNDDYLNGQAPGLVAPSATSATANPVFCHSFYAVMYSTVRRDPLWTSYRLTSAMAKGGDSILRYQGNFVHQSGLSADRQGNHNDFLHPPYDRGHMTPANDAIDMPHQADTFVVTNIVPQASRLNEGLSKKLEGSVHLLAEQEGEVFIVTGPIFEPAQKPMNGIAVPAFTFKAIYVPSRNIALAYVATNEAKPVCVILSVADLTRQAGVDPFPSLPASLKSQRPNFTLPVTGRSAPVDCHAN